MLADLEAAAAAAAALAATAALNDAGADEAAELGLLLPATMAANGDCDRGGGGVGLPLMLLFTLLLRLVCELERTAVATAMLAELGDEC